MTRSPGQSTGRRVFIASRPIAHASAAAPTCPSSSGLITARIVWIRHHGVPERASWNRGFLATWDGALP